MSDRTNLWRTLEYLDPARFLLELRVAEELLLDTSARLGIALDSLSLRLRTQPLKPHREWRDAALFVYGMGLSKDITIALAPYEAEDFDAITKWVLDGQPFYCPLQLKELPPADLNEHLTLKALLDSLHRYQGSTDTVLAIKLSRKPEIDLLSIRVPEVPFAEVYVFWANAPYSASFIIYGDLKQSPTPFEFTYPGSSPDAAA